MFSWLFGGGDNADGSGKPAPAAPVAPPAPTPAQATLQALSGSAGDNGPPGPLNNQFDPTVLERIAKAAKELQDNRAFADHK